MKLSPAQIIGAHARDPLHILRRLSEEGWHLVSTPEQVIPSLDGYDPDRERFMAKYPDESEPREFILRCELDDKIAEYKHTVSAYNLYMMHDQEDFINHMKRRLALEFGLALLGNMGVDIGG